MKERLTKIIHECDFCVVGGGLAGMCAAIAAARRGVHVVIMQDRPLFGGNASSEIRMWVCGANGDNKRETGIIEEINLENLYRNPSRGYPVWDSILFEFVKREKNIDVLLNCSCNDCEMEGGTIKSITGWQTTTQKFHEVRAKLFADCSGDSILAPLTGALCRTGREARSEYEESIAPEVADKKTMGMSCLIQARKSNVKSTYIPPVWAYKFTKDDLPYRLPEMENPSENFWSMELGGVNDSISDTEELRDELLKVAYGMWDFVKNSGEYDADNWELTFVGFLPGKRESRRYIGDYVLTQNAVRSGEIYTDTCAYGGWTMDDHVPEGIWSKEPPTTHHDAPSPYCIPYRCLYSKNIDNLFFAGRNISVTHSALSSTRVMATCALLGQAVGTAASVCKKYGISPRGVYEMHIDELKYDLMYDGCWLPGNTLEPSEIMKASEITSTEGETDVLLNGHERPVDGDMNCWQGKPGSSIEVRFDSNRYADTVRIVFDSDLNRETIGAEGFLPEKSCICNMPLYLAPVHTPETLVKDLKLEILIDGKWEEIDGVKNNHQRIAVIRIKRNCGGIRITPLSTHGSEKVNIFSVNIY
ncbi:MAG: FAD-dependent oxidoreductase [Clostridiales bacterium]|nr:FAD-dependent oxidoreductase [Clostridiales bacterium]